MRHKERIPVILEAINLKDFISSFKDLEGVEIDYESINMKKLQEYWEKYPDLRLVQVLVNLDIIPNVPGFWYYTEEVAWVIEHGILEPRDILFWGVRFDENMNRLEHPYNVAIKDLDSDHIKAILEGKFTHSQVYIDTFEEELKRREVYEERVPFCSVCLQENLSVIKRDNGLYMCDDCYADIEFYHS